MTAIKATLHSYKSLATRKQLQITLEVPSEYAETALKMLGVADPSGTQWFGLTRLNGASVPDKAAEPEPASEKPRLRSNLAAILCKENNDFVMWLAGGYRETWLEVQANDVEPCASRDDVADRTLKKVLGIKSKRELDEDPKAADRFDRLTTDFAYRNQVR